MSFFSDAFTSIGAIGIAFAVTDAVRHYFPNQYRVIYPAVIVAAADAYVPQFSILTPGWIVGTAVATGFLWWFLNRQKVIRQDGSVDHG